MLAPALLYCLRELLKNGEIKNENTTYQRPYFDSFARRM